MTVVSPPSSEDEHSPRCRHPLLGPSSLLPPPSVHPRSTFYSHRLQMWIHDKDSPLSSSTAHSFSFARAVAHPLPPLLPRSPSPPASSAPLSSPSPPHPPSLLLSSLPSSPRHQRLSRLLLALALLLLLAGFFWWPRLPSLSLSPSHGYTLAQYIASHPSHPLSTSLSPSSDHTHSPSLPHPIPDAEAAVVAEAGLAPAVEVRPSSFVSRAVHLEALARRKKEKAAAVEAEGGGRSKEEVREEAARRMLGRLKRIIEDAEVGTGAKGEGEGEAVEERRRLGTAEEVMEVSDSPTPWSTVRDREDEEVRALQHRVAAWR